MAAKRCWLLVLFLLICAPACDAGYLICPAEQRTELDIPDGKSLLIRQAAGSGDYGGLLSDGSWLEIGAIDYQIRLDYRLGLGFYVNGPARLKVGPFPSRSAAKALIFYELIDSQPYSFALVPTNGPKTIQVPAGQTLHVVAATGGGSGGPRVAFQVGTDIVDFSTERFVTPISLPGPAETTFGAPLDGGAAYTLAYFFSQTSDLKSEAAAALAGSGIVLEALAEAVASKVVTALPDNYGIATKADLSGAIAGATTQAIAQVQAAPNDYNLFSSTQYQANRITGVAEGKAEVTSNPTAYSLYTPTSIMDLRMGGLMIQKQGTDATIVFQPQTTTDLATVPFTNNGPPITNAIPMPGDKGFLRVGAIYVPADDLTDVHVVDQGSGF